MKYKIGDKVRVKSLEWYNENKNISGYVNTYCTFTPKMVKHCGKETVIKKVIMSGITTYILDNIPYYTFCDEMLEPIEDKTPVLEIPVGYEFDRIESGKVILKKSKVTTYDTIPKIKGYTISQTYKSEQEAISAIAMAKISQLLPYYGGAITDKEWADTSITKYVLTNYDNTIIYDTAIKSRNFLAFHTIEQRSKFMAYQDNIDLVNDYLMIYGNNRIKN